VAKAIQIAAALGFVEALARVYSASAADGTRRRCGDDLHRELAEARRLALLVRDRIPQQVARLVAIALDRGFQVLPPRVPVAGVVGDPGEQEVRAANAGSSASALL